MGKTSIAKRLIQNRYNKDEDSTHGVRIIPWNLELPKKTNTGSVENITLNLWDFGGQEIYHATHRFFMTYRALYVLVWDCRTEEKVEQEPEEFMPYPYWLDKIRALSSKSPILMVQNKIDQKKCGVDNQSRLIEEYNVQYFLNVSAEDNIHIDSLKNEICRQLASHPTLSRMIGIEFPKPWQEIRTKLKLLNDENDQHKISKPDYTRLCSKNGIDEKSSEILLEYMHVTGDVFFYTESERLKDTIIIDPKWALDRIYELLDDEITASDKNNPGEFTLSRVHQKLERFSEDKRLDILELLKKFELIFEKPGDSKSFIAPQYLPDEPPSHFNQVWNSTEDPILVYRYPNYVHRSIMVQFLSRFGDLSVTPMYWKNGMLIMKNGVRVLVKHPPGSLDVTITIERKGDRSQTDLLRKIRSAFSHINWNAGVKELIPYRSVETEKLHYFELDELVQRFDNGQRTIEGHAPEYEQLNIRSLLEGIIELPEIEEDLGQDPDNQPVTREYLDSKFDKAQSFTRRQHERTRSTLKNELEKLQSTILNRFDDSHRQLIEELTSQMNKNRLVMLEKIYSTVEEVSNNETEKFLEATQKLIENAELPDKAAIEEKINDPTVNASAKLKIAIPVWTFINFEEEAGVEWEESIPTVWKKFIDFFKKGYEHAGPTLRGLNK